MITTREGHAIYPSGHSIRAAVARTSKSLCAGCMFLGDLCQTQQKEHAQISAASSPNGIASRWVVGCNGYVEELLK